MSLFLFKKKKVDLSSRMEGIVALTDGSRLLRERIVCL